MPVTNTEAWTAWKDANEDPYGRAVVVVAEEVMRLLDERPGPFDPHTLICTADDNTKVGGISGFMAGCVAQVVAVCHSRGDEFRRLWNKQTQIGDEGDRANDAGGVLNPALLNIGRPPGV